jgi:hypothetical protein
MNCEHAFAKTKGLDREKGAARGDALREMGLMRCLLLTGALLLSACASKPTGNEYGGVVMQGQTNADKAFRQAQEHCQQYGKSAKLTNRDVHNESGDPVLFECLRANASFEARERER